MPGFDRTGPWGDGPRSGWGAGYCRGAGSGGSYPAARGRGGFPGGRGFGGGRCGRGARGGRGGFRFFHRAGWQPGFYETGPAYPGEQAEKEELKIHRQRLSAELENVDKLLAELEKEPDSE